MRCKHEWSCKTIPSVYSKLNVLLGSGGYQSTTATKWRLYTDKLTNTHQGQSRKPSTHDIANTVACKYLNVRVECFACVGWVNSESVSAECASTPHETHRGHIKGNYLCLISTYHSIQKLFLMRGPWGHFQPIFTTHVFFQTTRVECHSEKKCKKRYYCDYAASIRKGRKKQKFGLCHKCARRNQTCSSDQECCSNKYHCQQRHNGQASKCVRKGKRKKGWLWHHTKVHVVLTLYFS